MDAALRIPLDPVALRRDMPPLWRRLQLVESTGSTNADVIARAARGEDVDGLVLIAENQTAGRGRMGRTWVAASGAQIIVSVGVGVGEVPVADWGWLPLATGVAVVDAVATVAGVEAGLKWPNDVMAGGCKLAGILAEAAPSHNAIVVGVGINVTMTAVESRNPNATSLLALGVEVPDRQMLTAQLLTDLAVRVRQWRGGEGGGSQLKVDYRKASVTIGRRVRASLPSGCAVVGTATDVDEQGRLLVEANGEVVTVSAGDVVTVRPTDEG